MDSRPDSKSAKPGKNFSDLQQYLEEELGTDKNLADVFTPLTSGLGLESPASMPQKEIPLDIPVTPSPVATRNPEDSDKKFRYEMKAPVMETPAPRVEVPPPLPQVAAPTPVRWGRRLMAGILNLAFVITLWAFSVVISLKIVTGSFVGFTVESPLYLNDVEFIQFAALQYVAIWSCYLILCLGLLNMTFGMWIWGFKVDYQRGSYPLLRKFARTLFSLLFCIPILPAFLLGFMGKNGRNLLDVISGTRLVKVH